MADYERRDENVSHHREGEHIIFDPPRPKEEILRDLREEKDYQYKTNQIATNNRLVFLTLILAVGTIVGSGISIWQASIAQQAANSARTAADAATDATIYSNGQFDRMMRQTVSQTVAQVISANAAKSAAITANDSLIAVQRAFVFATGFDGIRIPDPKDPTKVGSLEFSITWENSGTTPTRKMISYSNWFEVRHPLTDDFPYPDLGNKKTIPVALGPKGVAHTTPFQVPARLIQGVLNHEEHLYFWGWARYRDIFPNTKPHITRFCVELTGFQGNPLDGSPNSISRPVLANCASDTSNCYDDGCKVK